MRVKQKRNEAGLAQTPKRSQPSVSSGGVFDPFAHRKYLEKPKKQDLVPPLWSARCRANGRLGANVRQLLMSPKKYVAQMKADLAPHVRCLAARAGQTKALTGGEVLVLFTERNVDLHTHHVSQQEARKKVSWQAVIRDKSDSSADLYALTTHVLAMVNAAGSTGEQKVQAVKFLNDFSNDAVTFLFSFSELCRLRQARVTESLYRTTSVLQEVTNVVLATLGKPSVKTVLPPVTHPD